MPLFRLPQEHLHRPERLDRLGVVSPAAPERGAELVESQVRPENPLEHRLPAPAAVPAAPITDLAESGAPPAGPATGVPAGAGVRQAAGRVGAAPMSHVAPEADAELPVLRHGTGPAAATGREFRDAGEGAGEATTGEGGEGGGVQFTPNSPDPGV